MGIFRKKKNPGSAADVTPPGGDYQSKWRQPPKEYVELGTIRYANLTSDARHGSYEAAVAAAAETGRPIFANFVEWSG